MYKLFQDQGRAMETQLLFYKKYRNTVNSSDYIEWALKMLEKDYDSHSLYILASLREPINIFEVEDYFWRAFGELNLAEPTYVECAYSYIICLSHKILVSTSSCAMEIADAIFEVVRDLDYPGDLEDWYKVSEKVDGYRYGYNGSEISKDTLISIILDTAAKYIRK